MTCENGELAASASSCAAASAQWDSLRRFGLYLVYFVVVELLLFNNLQFTTTAFLAAQAGVFLLLLTTRRPIATAALPFGGALLLLCAAGLIRLESLWMALLLAVPLGFSYARQAVLRTLIPGATIAALAITLLILANVCDRAAYDGEPEWSGFFDYNRVRVKFNDYQWTSYTPHTASVFSAVGWTRNDHEMIAHWFFDDPTLYSQAHLRFILDAYPWKTARLTADYCWRIARGLLRDRSVWSVILVLPFLLTIGCRSSRARSAVVASAIAAVAVIILLSWDTKALPARVYFPILSFPISVALLFPAVGTEARSTSEPRPLASAPGRWLAAWRTRRASASAVAVLLAVGIVMGACHQARRSVRVHHERHVLQAFLARLHPSGRELYVCWEAAMPFELVSPWDNLLAWTRIPLVNLVWTQHTPWQDQTKRRFGISNLAESLYQRDDIVLVASPLHRLLFATFAKEHFDVDVEFVEWKSAGEKLVAGRFKPRDRPDESSQ
jgi:hypothetical protein